MTEDKSGRREGRTEGGVGGEEDGAWRREAAKGEGFAAVEWKTSQFGRKQIITVFLFAESKPDTMKAIHGNINSINRNYPWPTSCDCLNQQLQTEYQCSSTLYQIT